MIAIQRILMLCVCLFAATEALGQTGIPIQFRNTLDSPINLVLTNTLDGSETTLRIARDDVADFAVPGGATFFDVRVMPLDNTQTGFRFERRNLPALAVNFRGQPVPVGGILEPRCYWQRVGCIFKRWQRYCRNERVAAFIDEVDAAGNVSRVTAPVTFYSSR